MDWLVNIRGNAAEQAKKDADAIDSLTAALKAEEAALKRANVQQAKFKATGVIDVKSFNAGVAAKKNIEGISKALGELKATGAQGTKIGFFDAIAKSGGPIGGLVRNFRAIFEGLKSNPWAAAAVGITGVTIAVVALSKAIATVAWEAATGALKLADMGRSARILNDAADLAGGTHNQLTGIINEVANATPLAKDKISEMARELRRLRFDSRQTQLVLSASSIATSALGDSAGSAVKGIAEASKATRRFTLGARDLYGEYEGLKGTGLSKADVFAQLAKQFKTSQGDVELQLRQGRIGIRQGLEAIDDALKKKFGGTIRAQLLSLDVQFSKMREDAAGLFSGINIEPLLKGLKSITSIFSMTNASGAALRKFITSQLDELAATAARVFPYIESFVYGFGTGLLDVYTTSIKPMLKSFAEGFEADGLEGSFTSGESAAKALAGTLAEILDSLKSIASAAKAVASVLSGDAFTVKASQEELDAMNAKLRIDPALADAKAATDSGKQLVAGIVAGIKSETPTGIDAVVTLARQMQEAFTNANKIQSPSKVFEDFGKQLPRGAARGVASESGEAQAAVDAMVSPPTVGGSIGGQMIGSLSITVFGERSLAQQVQDGVAMALRGAARTGPVGGAYGQ